MTAKKFFVETFGCQMNVNDSEKVTGLLRAEGYEPTAERRDADVVFINTCAVRERAADKLDHSLGRLKALKAQRPDLVVGVGGCVAQLEGRAIAERSPLVDVLVGTRNVHRVPELVGRAMQGLGRQVDLDRQADSFSIPDAHVAHGSSVRAYVTAIEGCNHVCSFCVVPRTRGPEACRSVDAIVAEVRSLVARGYAEVMLLGQTVNAYRDRDHDFRGLLERVHAVEGLRRLRFTTSHPSHVSTGLADAFRDLPRLCPYLHLPVQSGSDRILASMRRGYTADAYRRTVDLLRSRRPDLALSSDVIVGYPGETQEDFEATERLVADCAFDGLFVFMYSPRPGTTAVRLEDDVREAEKKRRFQALNQRQQRHQAIQHAGRVGSRQEVLVDEVAPDGTLTGRTPHFRIVHLDGPAGLMGRTVDVEIVGSGANSLRGRLTEGPGRFQTSL
jgi:tRNA-2-methylthio-N6-dimethylallyladenosine synthase